MLEQDSRWYKTRVICISVPETCEDSAFETFFLHKTTTLLISTQPGLFVCVLCRRSHMLNIVYHVPVSKLIWIKGSIWCNVRWHNFSLTFFLDFCLFFWVVFRNIKLVGATTSWSGSPQVITRLTSGWKSPKLVVRGKSLLLHCVFSLWNTNTQAHAHLKWEWRGSRTVSKSDSLAQFQLCTTGGYE